MTCCRCHGPADAWMTFEYAAGHVELHDIPEGCDGYGGYPMCAHHADAVSPPRGWRLTDHRDGALRLFPLTSVPASPTERPIPDSEVA